MAWEKQFVIYRPSDGRILVVHRFEDPEGHPVDDRYEWIETPVDDAILTSMNENIVDLTIKKIRPRTDDELRTLVRECYDSIKAGEIKRTPGDPTDLITKHGSRFLTAQEIAETLPEEEVLRAKVTDLEARIANLERR